MQDTKPVLMNAVWYKSATRLLLNTDHFQIHNFDGQFFIIPITMEGSDVYNQILFNSTVVRDDEEPPIELHAEPAAI